MQNAAEETDEDVYEFTDEGLGKSQESSQESPPKPNMVSVSIQTRPEDLEADNSFNLNVPSSPVKNRNNQRRPPERIMLANFNPVVDLKLPVEYWMQ